MTYQESADLMTDQQFRGRIKVAALTYAAYILGEAPGAAAHNSRYKWAQATYLAPDQTAGQLQPAVVMEPLVQTNSSAVTDADLQTSVEAVVNMII